MKHREFMMGMVFAALTVMVFAACPTNGKTGEPTPDAAQEKTATPVPVTEPEIIIGLAPGSLEIYMDAVNSHTDTLVKLLREKKAAGDNLTEDDWNKKMAKTYLKKPKLIWNGRTFEGKEVITTLNIIIRESQFFEHKNTQVNLDFIPYDPKPGSRWMKYNDKKPPESQIDFIGYIKSTIAYNGDFEIEGEAPHRRICEPEF